MNYGALIFLAAFVGLAGSWFTFVLKPTTQMVFLQQTNVLGGSTLYPVARPGLARQGLEVYRANGCAYCHSQQVTQKGSSFDVMVTDAGTNRAATVSAMVKLNSLLTEAEANRLLDSLPVRVLETNSRLVADDAVKTVGATSAKAGLSITPFGPDIDRGWGKRRSVAEDFLYDNAPPLGSTRIGPDLANAGLRLPDPNWHLRHLYAPKAEVKGSTMPAYPFLFESRRVGRVPSPEALHLPSEYAPPSGFEIVPTMGAKALVAYLASLKADVPLFSAPRSVAAVANSSSGTNAPAPGGSANVTNSPAQ